MKGFVLLVIIVVAVAVSFPGCVAVNFSPFAGTVTGTGEREKYEIKVGDYTELEVDLYCDVEYYSAPSGSVWIEIQPNLREHIKIEEKNGVLTINATKNINITGKAPVVTVSNPNLCKLTLAGAGELTTHDKISADSFTLKISGAGNGEIELDAREFNVNMSGAGDYRLKGTADKAGFVMSGAGMFDALALQAKDADVKMSGAGIVKVYCTGNLKVDASGVGAVEYKGSPAANINKSGLVTVKSVS